MEDEKVKQIVKKRYTQVAESGCGCKCNSNKEISSSIGYSEEEMNFVPESNLGLGCGNPSALTQINKGDTVLDLGSGAGFDAFIVRQKVGDTGIVIGVDMTDNMLDKARQNAKKYGYTNVEFKKGDIEDLPVDDNSVDVVISNCVINLAPNKSKVFSEALRVLKLKGKLCVSDIVLLGQLTEEQKKDEDLIAGCVGGAILKDEYLKIIKDVGFEIVKIEEDKDISKRQYDGINLESIKIVAVKN